MALHIETPLIESRALSRASGATVWLKLDALQPSGSFKTRGIGFACETYCQRGARRFVSSSGGNAGLAVAYAGRRLSVPVTVVVPETTSPRAKELLAQENAEVIVYGASWQEANDHNPCSARRMPSSIRSTIPWSGRVTRRSSMKWLVRGSSPMQSCYRWAEAACCAESRKACGDTPGITYPFSRSKRTVRRRCTRRSRPDTR